MTQSAFAFDGHPEPAPPAVDHNLTEPLKRIQQEHNRRLLSRLLNGPIHSDELESCRALYGKRGSARLHDVKRWLQALGYQGDPIHKTTISHDRGVYVYALTEEALKLARREMGR